MTAAPVRDGETLSPEARAHVEGDHAPGAFLVTEAGGTVRRQDDASDCRPYDDRSGLLPAADLRRRRSVRQHLLPAPDPIEPSDPSPKG